MGKRFLTNMCSFKWRFLSNRAAFFRGQVEHPGRKLSGGVDDPVYVAINSDGVFIIDMDDVVGSILVYGCTDLICNFLKDFPPGFAL
jgi:hypothetical protein